MDLHYHGSLMKQLKKTYIDMFKKDEFKNAQDVVDYVNSHSVTPVSVVYRDYKYILFFNER